VAALQHLGGSADLDEGRASTTSRAASRRGQYGAFARRTCWLATQAVKAWKTYSGRSVIDYHHSVKEGTEPPGYYSSGCAAEKAT
jgi:hypothetical protein